MRTTAARTLDLLGLGALGGWAYVAWIAATQPAELPTAMPYLGIRKDTFGAACFGVSAVMLLLGGIAAGRGRCSSARRVAVRAVVRVAAILTTCGWLYIAANALTHPESLTWRLTHFAEWPREIDFGIACLIVSVGSVGWLRRSDRSRRRQ